MTGNQPGAGGPWQPTGIRLSDGSDTEDITGLPKTSELASWVFFDIDADATYDVSAQIRGDGTAVRGGSIGGLTFETVTVPEPGSFALAALGLLGLIGCRRRRK